MVAGCVRARCGATLLCIVIVIVNLVCDHATAAGAPGLQRVQRGPQSHHCIHGELQRRIVADGMPVAHVVKTQTDIAATGRSANVLADDWQPIRIEPYTGDLNDSTRFCARAGQKVSSHKDDNSIRCTDKDILTDERRNILREYLLTNAIHTHQKYLQVHRIDGRLVIPTARNREICGSFLVPREHTSDGIEGVDFAVYVASVPTPGAVVAWGSACAALNGGQPIAGVINVSPRSIKRDDVTVRTVTHELLHALGFSQHYFEATKILRKQPSIRGKPDARSVLIGTNTVREARKHYNCPTLQWVELEDEGSDGTKGSHWKRRNLKDEMMTGITGISYYTAITIAAMEDLGYYKGNYTEAETMTWGRNAGCDLLTEKCMTNNITKWPSMFCNDSSTLRCSSDRTGAGVCVVSMPSNVVEPYYEYFTDPDVWGSPNMVDHCPIVENAISAVCTDPNNHLPGSLGGPSMTCLDANNLPFTGTFDLRALCVEVLCDKATQSYQVRVQGSDDFFGCPVGETINLNAVGNFASGTVTCAPYEEVCQVIATPSGASTSSVARKQGATLLARVKKAAAFLVR